LKINIIDIVIIITTTITITTTTIIIITVTIIIIIIIISPSQSTAGLRPLQYPAISLDPRSLASSSCQPSCANRHSYWL
jgi:hypothetical protein